MDPEYSSQEQSPPIVLIGIRAFVRKSFLFFANVLLTIVNGDPVSRSAVIACGSGYSNPIARPASIASRVFITVT